MKEIRYFSHSVVASYQGPIVKLGAGVETWEANNFMISRNFTFVAPKLPTETVGVAGGWVLGGGHSNLASMYGLGADNVVQLDFVTADGRYLTATEDHHPEYFYALRGGGGSTFAIVTSVSFKAFPGLIALGTAQFSLTTSPIRPSGTLQTPTANISTVGKFWTAVGLYLAFAKSIVNAGGFGHGDITTLGNNSFSFSGQFLMPGMSAPQTTSFITPLFDSIRAAGVNISTPIPTVVPYAQPGNGTITAPGSGTFFSRLIPRSNWDNTTILSQTTTAIRKVVAESGYSVRTRAYAPTLKAAGNHAAQAVNPAMRNMILHTTVFAPNADVTLLAPELLLVALQELDNAVGELRKVTPGSGAYFNEAGKSEANWQESFFGKENYKRLLKVKREVDPLGVFWAPQTVGSEEWRVETADGLPTGNGPLCRVGL